MLLKTVQGGGMQRDLPKALKQDIQEFIDSRYIGLHGRDFSDVCFPEPCEDAAVELLCASETEVASRPREAAPCAPAVATMRASEEVSFERVEKSASRLVDCSLEDMLAHIEDTFSEALLYLIDQRGLSDPDVYKRANIDRKLFSKIRSNAEYKPSKSTALALAIALELNLDETRDFIGRAGYVLSHSSKADIIVEYFIEREIFNIFEINEALFAFNQPLIGC